LLAMHTTEMTTATATERRFMTARRMAFLPSQCMMEWWKYTQTRPELTAKK
jgi:hypothetical protein